MRVVLASLGSFGDFYPMLTIGQALREQGHSAVIAAPPVYGPRAAALGLEFHPLRPDFPPDVVVDIFSDPANGGRRLLDELVFPHVRESFADLLAATEDADALVAGELVHVAPLVAARRGIPWANSMLAPNSMLSLVDPSVYMWFPAGYHLRHLGTWPQRLMLRIMGRQMTRWAEPLMALKREMGMETGDILAGKFSPHLVLVMFPPVFAAPQRDWPAAAVQTSFPYFAQEATPATQARIDAFLAAGAPPVVFTLGTTAVHIGRDFYKLAAETALSLGRRAILLMGKNPPPDAPADQILALDYAPHASVFPHAAAVVHHGGVGGCAEAIRAGVPVLTIPFAFDQLDNAMRMQRMGVGAVIPQLKKVTPATLERSLKAVLDDTGMAARARAVAREIDPAADMARTVAAIEGLQAGSASRAPTRLSHSAH